jgi:tetratricopeptide (TPR) repeat protein
VCLSFLACVAAFATSHDLQKTLDDLDNAPPPDVPLQVVTTANMTGGIDALDSAPSPSADKLRADELLIWSRSGAGRRALRIAATPPPDHLWQAQRLAANGQHQQAVSEFTESIAMISTGRDGKSVEDYIDGQFPNRLCQDYYGRAYEYSQLGMHGKAVEDYREGTRVDQESTAFTRASPDAAPYLWQPDYIAANPLPSLFRVLIIAAAALVVLFSVISVGAAIRSRLFLQILLLPLLITGVFSPGTDTCTLLHFGISAIAAYSAFRFRSLACPNWVWFYGLIAAFYNPFVRVHLDESAWSNVDFVCALILLGSFFPLARRVQKTRITQPPAPATAHNCEVAPDLVPEQASRQA